MGEYFKRKLFTDKNLSSMDTKPQRLEGEQLYLRRRQASKSREQLREATPHGRKWLVVHLKIY